MFTVGLVWSSTSALSLSASADPLLMPLDDTYIHFQYARSLPTASRWFTTPAILPRPAARAWYTRPLLAVGYLAGFTGWTLAYWALLAWACWLPGRGVAGVLDRAGQSAAPGASVRAGVCAVRWRCAFALSGPFIWAALSGMETTLFVFVVLLTLYAAPAESRVGCGCAAVLMAWPGLRA